MQTRKVYVEVVVRVNTEGEMRPLSIKFEDGNVYQVDKLVSRRLAASTKVGGCGMRYTIMVLGRETFLFSEDNNKWFVEAKVYS